MNESQIGPQSAFELVRQMEADCFVGYLEGKEGIPLFYVAGDAGNCRDATALVVVQGRNDSVYKYAELFHDLKDKVVFFACDHRGQGLSGRLLDDPRKGHVADFPDYVVDLKRFLSQVVRPERFRRTIVAAHSMGGAIACLACSEVPVDGLFLSTPMIDINTSPLPRLPARLLISALVQMGFGACYIPGGGYRVRPFAADNPLTSSKNRYQFSQDLVELYPKIALGDPTNRWLQQAFSVRDVLMANAPGLTVPVFLLQAEKESVVDSAMQRRYCQAVANCTCQMISGSRHEIFMERDVVRNSAMKHLLRFLADG